MPSTRRIHHTMTGYIKQIKSLKMIMVMDFNGFYSMHSAKKENYPYFYFSSCFKEHYNLTFSSLHGVNL